MVNPTADLRHDGLRARRAMRLHAVLAALLIIGTLIVTLGLTTSPASLSPRVPHGPSSARPRALRHVSARRWPSTRPPASWSSSVANNSGRLNDTWTWNGSTWTQPSPASQPLVPPIRLDGLRPGYRSTGALRGRRRQRHSMTPGHGTEPTGPSVPGHQPSGPLCASMAYDPGTGQLVLFGGGNGAPSATPGPGTADWTQPSPAAGPPARVRVDGLRPGHRSRPLRRLRQWRTSRHLDVERSNWTSSPRRPPLRPVPPPWPTTRHPATGALRWKNDSVSRGHLGLERTTWTEQSPATRPRPHAASMAYDPGTGQLVLFGGPAQRPPQRHLDVALGRHHHPTQLSFPRRPPRPGRRSMAFDPASGHWCSSALQQPRRC